MRLAPRTFRRVRLPAGLVLAAAAAAVFAGGAALPAPPGDERPAPPPVLDAAAVAREYRDDPEGAAARYAHRPVRVRLHADRVGAARAARPDRFRVEQDPVGDLSGAVAELPVRDRGEVTEGRAVVVWALVRGYAGDRLDLGGVVPD